AAGTVVRRPGQAGTVEAATRRVGGGLPASDAAFLAVSNGAYANGCGVVTRSSEYGLLPAGHVCRVVDVAADHVGLWVETFGGVEPERREDRADGQDVRSFARFAEADLIRPIIDANCD